MKGNNDYYEVACEENQKKYKIPIDNINFKRNGLFYPNFVCRDSFITYIKSNEIPDIKEIG